MCILQGSRAGSAFPRQGTTSLPVSKKKGWGVLTDITNLASRNVHSPPGKAAGEPPGAAAAADGSKENPKAAKRSWFGGSHAKKVGLSCSYATGSA